MSLFTDTEISMKVSLVTLSAAGHCSPSKHVVFPAASLDELATLPIMRRMMQTSELSPHILLDAGLRLSDLNVSPLCVNGMKLLAYALDVGGIPLTQSMANFNRRCVEWAADEFRWPGYESADLYALNKVLNEPDFPPLFCLHSMFLNARLIRHHKGKAVLTKVGKSMLGEYGGLQTLLFDRAFFDSDPYGGDPRVIEAGLWDIRHILNVVCNRLGNWVSLADFTEMSVPVVDFPTTGPLGAKHNAMLYVTLNAVRPMSWLGLIEVVDGEGGTRDLGGRHLRKTLLFDKLIRLAILQTGTTSLH
jgi:hypothetical protein